PGALGTFVLGINDLDQISGYYNDANFVTHAFTATVDANDAVTNMVIYAGNSGDSIDASNLAAGHPITLVGGAGNDILSGGAGNDLLVSGTGVDTLNGNGGFDTFGVNNSADTVTQVAGSNGAVYANVDFTLPTHVDTLVVQGAATHGTGNSDAAGD